MNLSVKFVSGVVGVCVSGYSAGGFSSGELDASGFSSGGFDAGGFSSDVLGSGGFSSGLVLVLMC